MLGSCFRAPRRATFLVVATALVTVTMSLIDRLPVSAQTANSPPTFPSSESGERNLAENTAARSRIGSPVAAADPDGDTLTYTISGDDAGAFDVDQSTGQLLSSGSLDYETKTSYSFTMSVHDGKDADGNPDTTIDDTIDVSVTVTNVDEAGTVSLHPAQPQMGTVLRATLSDPDGSVSDVTWYWSRSKDRKQWYVSDFGLWSLFVPTATERGRYIRAWATYTDGHGSGKRAIAVSDHAVSPAAPAPPLTVVTLVSGLTIPWDVAFAPDGTMLFTQRSGVLSSRLADGTVQTVTADLSDLVSAGERGLMGIVVDPSFSSNRRFYTCQGHSGGGVQVVAWTIDAAYKEATRVADPLVGGIPGTNIGSGCRLRFGPQGYLWISTGDAFVGTNPQSLDSLGGKILRVDASTGSGAPTNPFSSPNSPLIYSYGHRNPQGLAQRPGTEEMWAVEHGPAWDDEINLLERGGNYGWDPASDDEESGYDIRSSMTDLAEFPDAVEAKWSSGYPTVAPSGGIFLEGDAWAEWEGRLAVATLGTRSLLIFDFDADGSFVSLVIPTRLARNYGRLRTPMLGPDGALYITTSNGGGSDRILRVVPSRSPTFPADADTGSVVENSELSTTVATVTATDRDGDALTYSLSGPDASSFTVPDASVGELRSNHELDFESKQSYEVVVTATDPWGLSDSVTLTIVVIDVDEPPSITGNASVEYAEGRTSTLGRYAAEDPEGEDVAWSLAGDDGLAFSISRAGQLSPRKALDYEQPSDADRDGVYAVTVQASDGPNTASLDVSVTVTNVEEAGTIDLSSSQPRVGVETAAALTDPDGSVSGVTWAWARSSDRGDWSTIVGAASARYTPSDDDLNSFIRAEARYSDGEGSGKTALAVSANPVQAPPESNHPPRFPTSETGVRSVDESAASGTPIGLPVTAEDPDSGDTLNYVLGGSDLPSFDLDEHSGQLRTKAELDFERRSAYAVTVTAMDLAGEHAAITVSINVSDVNEAPAFATQTTEHFVSENAAPGENVGPPLVARDPEGDRVTYTLAGSDASSFHLDGDSGQLQTRHPLDDGSKSRYSVVVIAADTSGLSGRIAVTITVRRSSGREGDGGGGGGGGGGAPAGAEEPEEAEAFADLEEAGVHEQSVRALAASGVLEGTGCGGGLLCPLEPLLRWEMAVWLIRVVDGAEPQPARLVRFEDIDGDVWWAPHVERLAELGITVGCSTEPPARYCPNKPVTRGQMASFLARAFELAPAAEAGFADTADTVHRADIDALFAARITVGCLRDPIRYCPRQSTTRAQMASFLGRAVALRN